MFACPPPKTLFIHRHPPPQCIVLSPFWPRDHYRRDPRSLSVHRTSTLSHSQKDVGSHMTKREGPGTRRYAAKREEAGPSVIESETVRVSRVASTQGRAAIALHKVHRVASRVASLILLFFVHHFVYVLLSCDRSHFLACTALWRRCVRRSRKQARTSPDIRPTRSRLLIFPFTSEISCTSPMQMNAHASLSLELNEERGREPVSLYRSRATNSWRNSPPN